MNITEENLKPFCVGNAKPFDRSVANIIVAGEHAGEYFQAAFSAAERLEFLHVRASPLVSLGSERSRTWAMQRSQ